MSPSKDMTPEELRRSLDALKLPYLRDHVEDLAKQAAAGKWAHTQFLARLLEGETAQRQDNARAGASTTAIGMVNALNAANNAGRLAQELKKYTRPSLLIIDELGFLPIDKRGGDLLFQVISDRYERGAIIITTNKPFKHWPAMFNNDATLTSALLDRMLHHSETIIIEGKSYRMKDRVEP